MSEGVGGKGREGDGWGKQLGREENVYRNLTVIIYMLY